VSVSVERDGPLAVVTHATPPVNLWDEDTIAGFEAALDDLEGDLPRAVLVRAEGRVVSGGVDVNLFAQVTDGPALWHRMLAVPQRMEALEVPTVFAAHALCLTASFEVSLACDILLAADSARFGLVERVVGLTPAMGGTQRLVERAGPARAREVIYTGALFDAATLERWNVVNRVLPDENFDDAARAFAMDLARGPTRAFAAGKRIVRAALEGGVERADGVTPDQAGQLFDTRDLQEAVTSFLEQGPGKAKFTGT
jgi:enoyl-CoA hydratase/carnithine racemase